MTRQHPEAADLQDRIRTVLEKHYHHHHPFNVAMHEGSLSPDEIRCWIRNRYHYQQAIPIKDSLILANMPSAEERRRWLPRIVEHDGGLTPDGGLAAWLRLGEAAGLARATLLDACGVLPRVRFAVDAYINFCRFRPWQEAVAASLTELFAPDLMSRRIKAFEQHYPWIASEGLDYFRSRVTQGRNDATEGLALLPASPRTPEVTERLVGAVEFKCDILWSILDAIAAASGDARSRRADQHG